MRVIKLKAGFPVPTIVDFPDDADFLKVMQETCNTVEISTVPALLLGPSFRIVCDEIALMKENIKANVLATLIYASREPLFGDAMIAEIGIDPESGEPDLVPVHDVEKVMERVQEIIWGSEE